MSYSWNQDHNDPSADIILVSTDHVRIRAHSWQLKRHSELVREMFTVPRATPRRSGRNDTFIHIDQEGRIVLLYLMAITFPATGIPSDTPLADLYHLHDVYTFMDSPQVIGTVDEQMKVRASSQCGKSWWTFVCASQRDDVEIARIAIGRFAEDVGNPMATFPYAISSEVLCVLPKGWMAELFKAHFIVFKGHRPKTAKSWKALAVWFFDNDPGAEIEVDEGPEEHTSRRDQARSSAPDWASGGW